MGAYEGGDIDKVSNVEKKAAPKHQWPTWWDGIDHPDVPFPKTKRLLGEDPGPDEILRRAGVSSGVATSTPLSEGRPTPPRE
jgi:hypothetical protein